VDSSNPNSPVSTKPGQLHGGGFLAIWDSRLARFVRLGGGSSALGDAVARPRDDRQKDLLRPALIKTVIGDSVNAVGFQIAFYYALVGLACAWHFRKRALTGLRHFIFLLAWPLLGAGFCLFIAVCNVPMYDSTTNVLGIGGIAIGVLPYLWSRSRLNRRTATLAA
jgi:hypothetical protein